MIRDPDHNSYLELLHLEPDGVLSPTERVQLERHLLSCARCRREREELPRLFEALADGKVAVRGGFSERVMAALPPAGWESRAPRTWAAAAAVLAVLALLSTALVGLGGEMPGAAALVAIAELLRSTVTAGAGLLTASWQGLGMAAGRLLGSPVNGLVFALFVLGIDILFLRLLMRSWRPGPDPASERARASSDER